MENKDKEQLLQDGTCILNGLSHWNEANVDKMVLLRFLTACQNYFSVKHSKLRVVEDLENKVEILMELLNDILQKASDRFVVYAVQKAMAVLLKFSVSEVKMKTYLNQTISLLEDDVCLQSKISILDLLIDLLQGETVHPVLDVVKVWFPQLAEKIIKVPSQKDEEIFLDTFLILWRKSSKQCQDLQLDNLWLVDYEKLIYILFNTNMADYIHFKNVIHLLKTFYPYGFSLCLKTSIETIYVKLGTVVFQWALTQGLRCTQVNSVRAFGGTTILSPNETQTNIEFSNLAATRQLAMLVLAVSATIVRSSRSTGPSPVLETLSKGLIQLNNHVTRGCDDGSYFDWIIDVFGDQDDALTEALLALLDIYCIGKVRCDILGVLEKLISAINPHRQFYLLLKMTGFDHSVLVDLLTSPETCALLYLTRYLKCVLNEWCVFTETLMSVVGGNDSVSSVGQEEKRQREVENSEQKSKKHGNKKMSEFINENENSNPTQVSCNQTSCTETKMECNMETTMNFDCQYMGGPLQLERCDQEDMRENKLSIKNDFAKTVSDNIICSVVSGGLEMLQLYSDGEDDDGNEDDKISKTPSCQKNSNNLNNMVAIEEEANIVAMEYDSIVTETCQKGDNSQDFSPPVDVIELAASLKDVEDTEFENVNSNHCLDETMATIIRVRLKLENLYDSNLLPFNPKPLVRLIEQCENLYES